MKGLDTSADNKNSFPVTVDQFIGLQLLDI